MTRAAAPAPREAGRHMLDGASRVLLAEALVVPTGLVTAIFLTRRLGPEGYGLFTLASVVVAWAQWSITSALSRATVKLVGESEDWRPVGALVLRLHGLASLAALAAFWVLADAMAGLAGEPALARYLRLLALDIPLFCIARAHRQILVGTGGFRPRAQASAGRWIGRLVLIVALVELGLSVEGAILGSLGASAIELVVSRRHVKPGLFGRLAFPWRRFFRDAVPLTAFALSLRLFDRLDLFMLTLLGGSAATAGIYGAAQNLSLVPGLFAMSISPLLLSTLTRTLRAGDAERAREIARNALRAALLLFPLAAVGSAAAPEIVSLLFGDGYAGAAPLLSVLLLGGVAMVVVSVATAVLTAAGLTRWTVAIGAPLLPLAAAGHLVLIPAFGALGAAIATAACAGLGAAASLWAVWRAWRIAPHAATFARAAALSAGAFALWELRPAAGAWILLELPVAALTVAGGLLVLGELGRAELAGLRSVLRRAPAPT